MRQFPDTPSSLRKSAGFESLDETYSDDVEDELVLELDDSPGTETGKVFRLAKKMSSHLWSDVAFDHWPTHKCIHALHSAYQMTGRQACLRATAQARRG